MESDQVHVVRAYRRDGTLGAGFSPFTSADVARLLRERGHVIIQVLRPLEDTWNHRVAGVGFTHDDAVFAESRPQPVSSQHFNMHDDIQDTRWHLQHVHAAIPCMPAGALGVGAAEELAKQHEALHERLVR